ncbi:hypothetical protein C8J56DRAFT_363854 [Mycena floridula]|nr:hypothetical protein C8J56DRAFT_363854 [Mycena floridula]
MLNPRLELVHHLESFDDQSGIPVLEFYDPSPLHCFNDPIFGSSIHYSTNPLYCSTDRPHSILQPFIMASTVTNFVLGIFGYQNKREPGGNQQQSGQSSSSKSQQQSSSGPSPGGTRSSQARQVQPRQVHFVATPPVVPRKRAVVINPAPVIVNDPMPKVIEPPAPTSSSTPVSNSNLRLSGSNLRLLDGTSDMVTDVERASDWSNGRQMRDSDREESDDDTVLPVPRPTVAAPRVPVTPSRRLVRTRKQHNLVFGGATSGSESDDGSDKTPRAATPVPSMGVPLAPLRASRSDPQTEVPISPSPQGADNPAVTFTLPLGAATPVTGLSMIEQLSMRPALLQPVLNLPPPVSKTGSPLTLMPTKVFRFGVTKDAKGVDLTNQFQAPQFPGSKATGSSSKDLKSTGSSSKGLKSTGSSSNGPQSTFQFGTASQSEFSFKFPLIGTTDREAGAVSPPLDVSDFVVHDFYASSKLTGSQVQNVRYGVVMKNRLCLSRPLSSSLDTYHLAVVNTVSGKETRLEGKTEALIASFDPTRNFVVALRRQTAKGKVLPDWPQLKRLLHAARKEEFGVTILSLKRLRDDEEGFEDEVEGPRKLRKTETEDSAFSEKAQRNERDLELVASVEEMAAIVDESEPSVIDACGSAVLHLPAIGKPRGKKRLHEDEVEDETSRRIVQRARR